MYFAAKIHWKNINPVYLKRATKRKCLYKYRKSSTCSGVEISDAMTWNQCNLFLHTHKTHYYGRVCRRHRMWFCFVLICRNMHSAVQNCTMYVAHFHMRYGRGRQKRINSSWIFRWYTQHNNKFIFQFLEVRMRAFTLTTCATLCAMWLACVFW